MPPVLADAGLALAAASLRVAAVGRAVRDVAGFALPLVVAGAAHRAGGVAHAALATARAVVGTCVHPVGGGGEKIRASEKQGVVKYRLNKTSGVCVNHSGSQVKTNE